MTWVDDWLGAARFSTYVNAASGSRTKALELYDWNTELSQMLMCDVAALEIALRNAYDAAMTQTWTRPAHWLLDPESPVVTPIWRVKSIRGGLRRGSDVNALNRRNVDKAVDKCGGASASPGKVIAELTFGFWRYLTTASHEKTLWVPHLTHAFAPKTSRKDIDARIGNVHRARNRIAHHEPLFNQIGTLDPVNVLADLVTVLGVLNPDIENHVVSTSRVAQVLAQRP